MPSYDVAHLHEQGQDMVIVPLDASFGRKSSADQDGFKQEFQRRSNAAGLRGTVCLVWDGAYIAPPPWRPFFRTLSVRDVQRNVNKVVSW